MIFLFLTKRFRLLTRLALSALGFTVFIALVFSTNGPAIVTLLWLAVLSIGLGSLLLDWFRLANANVLAERLLVGTALGLGVLALLTYLLGSANIYAQLLGLPTRYFKLLHPLPVLFCLVVLTILVIPRLYRQISSWSQSHATELRHWSTNNQAGISLSLAIFALCFIPLFFWALSPTIRFDSLVYHLAAPARYADFHGITEVTEPHHFYMSHYAEMLFTLAMVVVGQPLPGLLHLFSGLITLGLTVLIARRLGFPRAGWLAALLLVSLPIFYDAGTVHNDFFVAMFSLASFYTILAWWQDRRSTWLLVAGILAGLSIGTKINAVMPALVGGLAILVGQIYSRSHWKRIGTELAGYSFPILFMYVPWALLNGLWTHNPFFPFFCQYFSCSSSGLTSMPIGQGSFLGKLVNDFILLPINVTLFGENYYIENFGGAGGAVFLLSLPWFIAFYRAEQKIRKTASLLAIFSAVSFLFLLPFAQRIRYLLPVIPFLCIIAAINLTLVWEFIKNSSWRKIGISFAVLLFGLYFFSTRLVVTSSGWQLPERYPYQVALGFETPSEYLSRTLPSFDALQFINKQGDTNFKVASFGDETRIYTTADIHTFYYSNELSNILATSDTLADIADGLMQHGYKYILYSPSGIEESDYQIDTRMVSGTFLEQFARLVFARNNVYVYEIFPSDGFLLPGENLLTNAGFEDTTSSGLLSAWVVYNSPYIDASGNIAYEGKKAVKVSDQGYVYQRVPIQAGHLYTLGHWSKSEVGEEQVRLQVMWLDRKSTPISVTIEKSIATTEWAWNQMSYSAPDDAVFAQIYITTGSDQKAWFDVICFAEGPTCNNSE